MDKKDILRKARSQRRDEREKQIEVNSFRAGWLGVSLVMLILIGLRWYFNESAVDIALILLAQQFGSLLYQSIKFKNKKYFIVSLFVLGGILMGIASLLTSYGVF